LYSKVAGRRERPISLLASQRARPIAKIPHWPAGRWFRTPFMKLTLRAAVAEFGKECKKKLSNLGASGEPEDQHRAQLERLIQNVASLGDPPRTAVAAVGESRVRHLQTRPDHAITVRDALVGFVEIQSPGKSADPRKFNGRDKEQWEKLQSLPNLMYTDGNQFSLSRSREVVRSVVRYTGMSGRPATVGSTFTKSTASVWQPMSMGTQIRIIRTIAIASAVCPVSPAFRLLHSTNRTHRWPCARRSFHSESSRWRRAAAPLHTRFPGTRQFPGRRIRHYRHRPAHSRRRPLLRPRPSLPVRR
jgi:hypothetical protein